MPLIRVKLIEGAVSPDKKRQLITELTNSFVAVIGEDIRPITWVILEEVKNGDWGMAGEPCVIEASQVESSGPKIEQNTVP